MRVATPDGSRREMSLYGPGPFAAATTLSMEWSVSRRWLQEHKSKKFRPIEAPSMTFSHESAAHVVTRGHDAFESNFCC